MPARHREFFAATRRHPSAILLLVQLAGLLLYPLLESTRIGPVALCQLFVRATGTA